MIVFRIQTHLMPLHLQALNMFKVNTDMLILLLNIYVSFAIEGRKFEKKNLNEQGQNLGLMNM
jgi:hypothetical protein